MQIANPAFRCRQPEPDQLIYMAAGKGVNSFV
jgi:hypothetical protein